MTLCFAGASTISPKVQPIPSQFVDIKTSQGVLKVAKYETTVGQWRACSKAGKCKLNIAHDVNDNLPVSGLNWWDVQDYLQWYSSETKTPVRLPTREEWSVIAGEHSPQKAKKLFEDPRMAWAASYDITRRVGDTNRKPSGSFGVNENGIYDIRGNVWEWTSTCEPDLASINSQTQPCFTGRIAMGKHAAVLSDQLREPGKAGCSVGQPPDNVGFRIMMTPEY